MSHYQGDDAEYMADEYEMEDADDDMDEEFRAREMGSDSDVDEYDYPVCDLYYIILTGNPRQLFPLLPWWFRESSIFVLFCCRITK